MRLDDLDQDTIQNYECPICTMKDAWILHSNNGYAWVCFHICPETNEQTIEGSPFGINFDDDNESNWYLAFNYLMDDELKFPIISKALNDVDYLFNEFLKTSCNRLEKIKVFL